MSCLTMNQLFQKGGVLPSEPKSFESHLRNGLRLASKWGCVVLFDDAEVYLSERAGDVDKSRLVCSKWYRTLNTTIKRSY